jgi:hypothetical protein
VLFQRIRRSCSKDNGTERGTSRSLHPHPLDHRETRREIGLIAERAREKAQKQRERGTERERAMSKKRVVKSLYCYGLEGGVAWTPNCIQGSCLTQFSTPLDRLVALILRFIFSRPRSFFFFFFYMLKSSSFVQHYFLHHWIEFPL